MQIHVKLQVIFNFCHFSGLLKVFKIFTIFVCLLCISAEITVLV